MINYLLRVSVNKTDIFDEVRKTSSYIGAKALTDIGDSSYKHIAAQKEDIEMLNRFWDEACAEVVRIAKDFVSDNISTDDVFQLSLSMPDNYNRAFDKSLIVEISSFIVYSVLANWLILCGFDADVIAFYESKGTKCAASVSNLLNFRDNSASASVPENKTNSFGGDCKQNMGEAVVATISLAPQSRNKV